MGWCVVAGGLIDIEELTDIEKHATPCPGSCGGMFTANTMATFNEASDSPSPPSTTPDDPVVASMPSAPS